MRKLLLIICLAVVCMASNVKIDYKHEVGVKFASLVDHKQNFGFEWNEGFSNHAKGIEYLYNLDGKNSIGVTYICFSNSFFVKTCVKGFVYRRAFEAWKGIEPNIKLYALHQRGYYGSWKDLRGHPNSPNDNNDFWAPLASIGFMYRGFTIDAVGFPDMLTIVLFGYNWRW